MDSSELELRANVLISGEYSQADRFGTLDVGPPQIQRLSQVSHGCPKALLGQLSYSSKATYGANCDEYRHFFKKVLEIGFQRTKGREV